MIASVGVANEAPALGTALPLDLHKRAHIGRSRIARLVNHFNILLVEEAGSKMHITDVHIVWHVLTKGVGGIMPLLVVDVDLAVHTLVEIKLLDISVLNVHDVLGQVVVSQLSLFFYHLLHLFFKVVDLALVSFDVLLVCCVQVFVLILEMLVPLLEVVDVFRLGIKLLLLVVELHLKLLVFSSNLA